MVPIVSRRLTWFAVAAVLAVAAIVLIVVRGIGFDADLRGAGTTPWVVLAVVLLAALALAAYLRSWRIGVATVLTTAFVLLVVLGLLAAIGWSITAGALAALLAVTLFALHELAVVFAAVVEESPTGADLTQSTHAELANIAANSTLRRALVFGLKVVLPALAVLVVAGWILGARSVCDVALVALVGLPLASASALFLAVPIEVCLGQARKGK